MTRRLIVAISLLGLILTSSLATGAGDPPDDSAENPGEAETPNPAALPESTPPVATPEPEVDPAAEMLQSPMRLLQEDRPADAFSQLAVILGSYDEQSPVYQGAQFLLGQTLHALNLPLSASYVFGDIASAGDAHPHYFETVDWFLKIQRRVPGDDESLGRLAEYDPMLYPPDDADEIRFMVGRHFYANDDLEAAKESLEYIQADAGLPYLKARFLLGVIHTRENAAQPALEAFKDILRYQRDGQSDARVNAIAEKAVLALGRLFYTAGQFDTATRYYDRIDETHPGWLDSLFEVSWSYYQVGNHSRALGNLHTLNSPYFADAYHPEALILQAVILYSNCHFSKALTTVRQFVDSYKPLKEELETQLRKTNDPNAFYAYLAHLSQSDRSGLSLRLKRVFNAALQDARLRRLLRHVVHLDRETLELEKLLKKASAGPARELVTSTLTILISYRDMLVADAGQAARDRLERVHTELRGLLSQGLRIKVEVLRGQRKELALEKNMSAEDVEAIRQQELPAPDTDVEHMYWPFDGEYWRDELGAYTFLVPNRCLKR